MLDTKMTLDEAILEIKSDPQLAELVTNVFLDDPVSEAAERYAASTEWKSVQALVGEPSHDGSVLDVGAGRGISSCAFAKDNWKVTALEPDPSHLVGFGAMRQLIDPTDVNFEIIDSWGESLPFNDNSFNVVYCRQVLHHARDLDRLIVEMVRVLKPGGIFLATREHVLQTESDLDQFLANHTVHQRAGGEHAFTLEAYTRAMKSTPLRSLSVIRPWDSPINTLPATIDDLGSHKHRKLRFLPRILISPWTISMMGRMKSHPPGTMYSFIGRKAS